MGVGIDQPRHHDTSAAIDSFARRVGRPDVADCENPAVINCYRTWHVHRELIIHRQHVRIGE